MRLRLPLVATLTALCAVGIVGAARPARSDIPATKVFVLAGDLNMLGMGFPLTDGAPSDPDVLVWRAGSWQPASDPLSGDSGTGVGPGLSFGSEISGDLPAATVGLVMCARAGQTMPAWKSGGSAYKSCVKAARAAAGELAGIVFLQGEADARRKSYASGWNTAFNQMVRALRADLGADLPVVLGQIGNLDPVQYPFAGLVREKQALAAARVPLVTLVSSLDLPLTDGVRFTVDSYKTLGERLALGWTSLVQPMGTGAPPDQVFVLAGQSNVVGRGFPLSEGAAPVSSLWHWRAGVWRLASDPLGSPLTPNNGVGPGMTFGLRALDYLPGKDVGLVMCGVAGTTMGQWLPSSGVYQSCVTAVRAAGGTVAGIVFVQGEADAQAKSVAGQWAARFAIMAAAFRTDFGSEVPIALSKVGNLSQKAYPGVNIVRDQQALAASQQSGVGLVETLDLPISADGTHYTVDAYKTLGVRLADAWWQVTT